MSSATSKVPLSSRTEKLTVLTHLATQLLQTVDGEIQIQAASSRLHEEIENLDTSEELAANEIAYLIEDDDAFEVGGPNDNMLEGVNPIGTPGNWLKETSFVDEMPDIQGSAAGIDELLANEEATSTGQPVDYSEFAFLSSHHADALEQSEFDTYRDLYNASNDELTAVPGITESMAVKLREEASEHIDPTEEIAREARQRELKAPSEDGTAETHLVTDVTIPSAKPRDPAEYQPINERTKVGELPVLEYPTLTPEILHDIAQEAASLKKVTDTLSSLIKYNHQSWGVIQTLTEEFESITDLEAALTTHQLEMDEQASGEEAESEGEDTDNQPDPKTLFSTDPGSDQTDDSALVQAGLTPETFKQAVEEAAPFQGETGVSPRQMAQEIDKVLKGTVPVKSRVRVFGPLQRELEQIMAGNSDTDPSEEITRDDTLNTLIDASVAPVELDHPFINHSNDFPEYQTRNLLTGETAIETAARVISKDNYALDLVGHAGVGKDTLIKVLAALTNRPIVVMNLDESMISQDLMGIHKIDSDGKVVFKDGVIPHCAKHGFILVLSEVNAASGGITTALHQLLERDGKLHIKERDEVIRPSPRFRVCTTRNPPTEEYNGAKEMNDALKRRLNSIRISYLDREAEIDLIDSVVNDNRRVISRDEIGKLVDLANKFRDNAVRQVGWPRLSPTKLFHIIDIYDGTDNLMGAAKESIRADLGPTHDKEACLTAIEEVF